ncbi:MAG: hypothetical protein ABI626_06045 [Sphingomicrobium sp.]
MRRCNIDSKTSYVRRNKVRPSLAAEARKLFHLDRISQPAGTASA